MKPAFSFGNQNSIVNIAIKRKLFTTNKQTNKVFIRLLIMMMMMMEKKKKV
jgi:hypothetical protein